MDTYEKVWIWNVVGYVSWVTVVFVMEMISMKRTTLSARTTLLAMYPTTVLTILFFVGTARP